MSGEERSVGLGAWTVDAIDGEMRVGGYHVYFLPPEIITPVVAAFRDAARLRSLAATFDSHLNRDQTYTGAQVAAMLRDGGE